MCEYKKVNVLENSLSLFFYSMHAFLYQSVSEWSIFYPEMVCFNDYDVGQYTYFIMLDEDHNMKQNKKSQKTAKHCVALFALLI